MIETAVRTFLAGRGIGACRLIVACSGGIDSTALLLALADLRTDGFELIAAHVNHNLRGAESDADESFVRDLCSRLAIPLEVRDGSLDPEAVRRGGIEAAAREVRHRLLHEIREARGAPLVATAHQQNDQAETILMRLMSGTGIAGLRAIHPVRDDRVIRPLLNVFRAEIEDFLRQKNVIPRVDSSNADPRFLRNRVRAMLTAFEPAEIARLASVAGQAQQVWALVEQKLDDLDRRLTRSTPVETRFAGWPEDPWLRQALLHRHIRRLGEHVRDVSSRDLERLTAAIDSIQRVSVTRDLEFVRRRGALVLRRTPTATPDFELLLAPGQSLPIPVIAATISLRSVPKPPATGFGSGNRQLFQLPEGGEDRFVVRNRRRGDRFRPLGMMTDKKLKDFLIDRRIEVELRDRVPLLLWNGEIVWVAGVEISHRFKVTSAPGRLYEVSLEHDAESDQARIHA